MNDILNEGDLTMTEQPVQLYRTQQPTSSPQPASLEVVVHGVQLPQQIYRAPALSGSAEQQYRPMLWNTEYRCGL